MDHFVALLAQASTTSSPMKGVVLHDEYLHRRLLET
jgi:hypothetical protein